MKLTPLGKATAAALAVIVLGVGVWRFTADRNDADEPTTAAIKESKAKASSAASTKKPAAPAKTAASISKELKTQWQKLMNENQEPIEIAVYSKQYNTTVTLNAANDTTHTTASILKVTF